MSDTKELRSNLKQLEIQYRHELNYLKLVDVYEKLLPISLNMQDRCDNIFKYSYCLAQIGLKTQSATFTSKAIKLINDNNSVLSLTMTPNEYYRAFTLITFFTTSEHNILVINQTLLDWLADPETAPLVKKIVFDYEVVLLELSNRISILKANNPFF